MAVLTDWDEEHEDVKTLQAIVDNYALDGVTIDIETEYDLFTIRIETYGSDGYIHVELVDHIDDIVNAIEGHFEAEYLNGVGR